MFAELDANGWAFIIGAIGVVLMQLLNAVLAFQREQRKIDRELATQEALKVVAADVKKIEVQTNSLTSKLVAETDASANKQGRIDERARADQVAADATVALAVVEATRVKEAEKQILSVIGEPVETIADDIAELRDVVEGKGTKDK